MAPVDLHPRAVFDARQARRRYRLVRADLADQFLAELSATISRIAGSPGTGSPHLRGTRMWRLHRFPYPVVYTEQGPDVLVLAVAHDRRRPAYWTRRLPKAGRRPNRPTGRRSPRRRGGGRPGG